MVLTGTYIPYSTPTYHIGHILDPRYHDMAPQMPQVPSTASRPPTTRICSTETLWTGELQLQQQQLLLLVQLLSLGDTASQPAL